MRERCYFLLFSLTLIIIAFAISACPEPAPALTGTVSISGTAHVGRTLTAVTDSLGGKGTISYQWKSGTGNIGANSSTYVVQDVDLGATITVTVSRAGYSGRLSSEPTAVVTLPLLPETVSISGNAWVGQTLTANTGFPDDSEGISYQWKRWGPGDGAAIINIGTGSTYVVQAADLGSTITVTVTCSGYSDSFSSEPTDVVILPPLGGTVSIDGIAETGKTLTANTASLEGTGTISYQWKREGTGGGAATNIGVGRTYTVRTADQGKAITVTVTRSGYSGNLTSEATDVVPIPLSGTVTISGIPAEGQTLTANTTNLGGIGTISYQWRRGILDIGTNSNTYIVQTDDEGYSITVTVTREGYSGSVSSNAVRIGSQTYGEFIKKVEFTETTETVTFNNLANNSIYLVKVNKSASTATANSTGSVQSTSPSFLSDSVLSSPLSRDERPRMGHPAATASRANPPPIERATFMPLADFIPPVVGDKKMFFVETYFDSGRFEQREATLLATGQYGNIWVINSGITTAEAQELSRNFDIIYPAETNILGYEYGGGPGGNGGKDGDPKIQILVYNFGSSGYGVLGYFWDKDFYDNQSGSNKAEIFYISSTFVKSDPELIYLTLAHEFQHMINFNRKYVQNSRNSATWYDETLSMMAEDIMANILGIPTTHADHPIRDHIPYFIESYTDVGFTEWDVPSGAYPYSKGYTFGAYLMRNYGGAELLKKILDNDTANIASITAALNEMSPGTTFETALSRFGEAMIFSGTSSPPDAFTFDKTVTTTVTAHNGAHTYTLPGFDIWNTRRYSSSNYGPVVYSLTQRNMRGHTVLLQQDNSWKDISGSISITLNKPSNANVEFYLMVR